VKKDKAAWAGSSVFVVLLMLVLIRPPAPASLFGSEQPAWAKPLVHRDLDAIRDDTLNVLVLRDPLIWEEHPGAVSGLEWELLERFARQEKLRIRAIPVDHPDSMLLMLQRGEGDVMAAQLTPQGWANRFVSFTHPYRSVAPLRVVLNSDGVVRPRIRDGHAPGRPDTLRVSRWSPFLGMQAAFDTAFGPVTLITDTALPEDLLVRVALGQCRAALVVDAVSSLETRRLPHIHFGPRLGRSAPLAFGVRTNSSELLRAIDAWLSLPQETEARELIAESYGRSRLTNGPLRTLHDLEFTTDSISPFDSLFQAHADSSAFDWELLAAVGFKESRFDTSLVSGAGAEGLMQIMPATAEALGVDSAGGVNGDIGGARRYLDKLDVIWRASVPNKDQRLKFVLASYNAGPGHIKDAQRLAGLYGLDTNRWDGSVERALLLLEKPRWFTRPEVKNGYCRAHETFWYVRDVVSAFGQYSRK
jgi:membrane-bound lytic murein transglycosylase F